MKVYSSYKHKMNPLLLIVNFVCLLHLINAAAVPPRVIKNWWKHAEIYHVDVWTYKDDNADGIGDFKGLRFKANHFEELGVKAIELSSIFSSLDRVGCKSGIHDFLEIHRNLGTPDDFDALIDTLQTKDINVILELPINHCSRYHEWFEKSQHKIEPFTDFFIWKRLNNDDEDDKKTADRWEWDPIRNESFYRHKNNIPHLNLRSIAVIEEIKNILQFWFDKGVSGVNFLSVNDYIEDPILKKMDIPFLAVFHEIYNFIESYNEENKGPERVFIVNKGSNQNLIDLHGREKWPMAPIVLNNLYENYQPLKEVPEQTIPYFNAAFFQGLFVYLQKEVKKGSTLFAVEDPRGLKLSTRLKNRQLYDVWITFLYMCPGLIHINNGQEIAVLDALPPRKKTVGYYPYGSAMPWDDSLNAGFTTAEFSSIRPNGDYWKVNVKTSKKAKFSTYHLVQDLLKLRQQISATGNGGMNAYTLSEWVFIFSRLGTEKEYYYTVLNTDNMTNEILLPQLYNDRISRKVEVVAATPNSQYQKGNEIYTGEQLQLRPMSAVVIKFPPIN